MSKVSCNKTYLYKFDVFLSFRGPDTRRKITSFFYKELTRKNIRTFKDDKELKPGCQISHELVRAIEDSRFAVVVVSENYSSSTHCLDELVKIIDCVKKGSLTVMPIFYAVDPSHFKGQTDTVAEHFKKHESRENHEKVRSWRQALTSLASISDDCSEKWDDDSEMVDEITERIVKTLIVTTKQSDLVGTDEHMEALQQLMDLNSNQDVRVVGIWARGGPGRSALARLGYTRNCQHFESHCFLENVKKCSPNIHLLNLQQKVSTLKNQKVLLVVDDVNTLEQLDALAQYYNSFGPGSVVIITTQDKMLLKSFGIKLVYEAMLLRFQVRKLFRQIAFTRRNEFDSILDKATNLALEWLSW